MGAPCADWSFLELVFWKSVCGFDLQSVSKPHRALYPAQRISYFFMTCLLRKAASFCVAGDWISSEGDTYCGPLIRALEIVL